MQGFTGRLGFWIDCVLVNRVHNSVGWIGYSCQEVYESTRLRPGSANVCYIKDSTQFEVSTVSSICIDIKVYRRPGNDSDTPDKPS